MAASSLGIIIGVIIILVIIGIVLYYFLVINKKEVSAYKADGTYIKPRPIGVKDCGYPDRNRGWYDVSKQGVKNDFCRWVGDPPTWWFSCHKAGSDDSKSPPSEIYDSSAPHDPLLPGTFVGTNCA